MLRAVIALLLVANVAAAEDEDPKAAIAARGIVLKASKRHVVVIVPAASKQEHDDPHSKLWRGTFYFGDTKTLFELPSGSWGNHSSTAESIELLDPRELLVAHVVRNGESFELTCQDYGWPNTKRTIALTTADSKTAALVAKAPVKPLFLPYRPYLLTRFPSSTQYLYVDRNRETDSQDFRLFMGKRGAMKKVAVKEVALDTTSLVLETAKGTLTMTFATKKDAAATATFGTTKKVQTLDVVPSWPNRKLVYQELGIYTRDRTGYPCDEL